MKRWIAVVDDEALSLTHARMLLGGEDMKVSCLRTGKDLLTFMKRHNPDLILLDVQMPEMNGFEVYRALRKQEKELGKPETPVIFLTGEGDASTENTGLRMGAADYVKKPFNKAILLRRIENIVSLNKRIESLTEDATIDKLTGFLNKASGIREVAEECQKQSGAFVILDLDSFKLVNDLHGHEMGDRVLVSFAEVVRKNIRKGDIICRIGGDEFLGFFVNTSYEDAIRALSQRLNDQIMEESKKLMGEDHGIPLGISLGVVMVPEYGREYEKLFACADEAMYWAKQRGKHGYALYEAVREKDAAENTPEIELDRVTRIIEERNEGSNALILGTEAFSTVYHFIMRFNKRYGGKLLKLLFVVRAKAHGQEMDAEAGAAGTGAAEAGAAGTGVAEAGAAEVDAEAGAETDPEAARYMDQKEVVGCFGEVLKNTLRRSDIILQSKSNEYFLLCPMMNDIDGKRVVERIMEAWQQEPGSRFCEITYAMRYES